MRMLARKKLKIETETDSSSIETTSPPLSLTATPLTRSPISLARSSGHSSTLQQLPIKTGEVHIEA